MKELIEQAEKLGFDDIYYCQFGDYLNLCLIQKWLRDEKEIDVDIWCNASGWGFNLNKTNGTSICDFDMDADTPSGMYETYEKALEQGIKEALKQIKR